MKGEERRQDSNGREMFKERFRRGNREKISKLRRKMKRTRVRRRSTVK